MILDTASGLSPDVINFVMASNETIIVTTPEPTAVTDAYAIIKTIATRTGLYDPEQPPSSLTPLRSCPVDLKLFVNMARSPREAQETADRIRNVARKFLRIAVDDFGFLLADADVASATCQQSPFVISRPQGSAARSIAALAGRVSANNRVNKAERGLSSFFDRLTTPETNTAAAS